MPERERYHQPALHMDNPTPQPSLRSKEESSLHAPDLILEEFAFELTQRARLELPEISSPAFRAIFLWRDGRESGR